MDPLSGLAGAQGKSGPQCGMTIDQRLKRAPQGRNIHVGADARGEIDIVNHALRGELVQKPYPLLIVRQGLKRLNVARLFPKELGKQGALFSRRKIGDSLGGAAHSLISALSNISAS